MEPRFEGDWRTEDHGDGARVATAHVDGDRDGISDSSFVGENTNSSVFFYYTNIIYGEKPTILRDTASYGKEYSWAIKFETEVS